MKDLLESNLGRLLTAVFVAVFGVAPAMLAVATFAPAFFKETDLGKLVLVSFGVAAAPLLYFLSSNLVWYDREVAREENELLKIIALSVGLSALTVLIPVWCQVLGIVTSVRAGMNIGLCAMLVLDMVLRIARRRWRKKNPPVMA